MYIFKIPITFYLFVNILFFSINLIEQKCSYSIIYNNIYSVGELILSSIRRLLNRYRKNACIDSTVGVCCCKCGVTPKSQRENK